MKVKGQECVVKPFELDSAEVSAGFDVSFLAVTFKEELCERLERKGLLIKPDTDACSNNRIEIQGRFLKVDEGDRKKRTWLLFGGQCVVELEGEVQVEGEGSCPFHVKCEQGEGFLGGGEARDLLNFSARLCAAQAAQKVVKGIKSL